MTKILNIRRIVLTVLFFSSLCFACRSDDDSTSIPDPIEEEPVPIEFNSADFQAQILEINDTSNFGNPSDIIIRFNGGVEADSITEYRILYVPNINLNNVSEASVNQLPDGSFVRLDNNADTFEINLNEEQLDFNGNEIIPDEDYVIFILTIGTFNGESVSVLSDVSSIFVLVNNVETQTLINDFPANDGLFVSEDGTIFASDFGIFDNSTGTGDGTKIYEITLQGNLTEKASDLIAPMGGVLDSQGNFYFAHRNEGVSGEIIQLTPDGAINIIGEINGWPSGLTIDDNDNIYVANFVNPTIHKISSDLIITEFISDQRLAGCVGIDIDDNGNIVTANFNNGDIISVDTNVNLTLITSIDVPQNFGIGYMTIFENTIYATGIGSNVIFTVDFNGVVDIFAGTGENGTNDGELREASFSGPNGIAIDQTRRILYVSQFGTPGLRSIQL